MNSKAELLSKIKKLAEAGFYGEQTNAAEILERLKKKYGITDADIAEDVETIIWIRYKTKLEQRLIWQVAYMVLGNVSAYNKGCRTKMVGIKASKTKCLEVLNILAQHILSDMEADLELQIKRLESCLWDKFRYTEDAVPEKSVK